MNEHDHLKHFSGAQAAQKIDKLIDQVAETDQPILLRSKSGHRAALISMDDFEFLEQMLSETDEPHEGEADFFYTDPAGMPAAKPRPLGPDFGKVYQFKITLKGLQPPIWRRIQVPENYTFWDLHVAIQDVMGWQDYHLHVFEMAEPRSGEMMAIGVPAEDDLFDRRTLPGWTQTLPSFFSVENDTAEYTYDFGDNWQHKVKLEKILPRVEGTSYPVCLKGKRTCPPEDCGGVWGYQDLLESLSDPKTADDDESVQWVGGDFDPDHFEAADVYFHDPRLRWEYAFGNLEEDDDNGGEEEAAADEDYGMLRVLNRQRLHRLWEKAKSNDLEGITDEDRHTVRIMLAHKDEFHNQFELADLTSDHRFDPESEVNPFLHICIHSIVETQIDNREPIEAFQFYNAMLRKKCSAHDAVHLIGMILAPMIFGVLKEKKLFDNDLYRNLLKKYKGRKPEKIADLLKKEPLLKGAVP